MQTNGLKFDEYSYLLIYDYCPYPMLNYKNINTKFEMLYFVWKLLKTIQQLH